MKFFKVFLVQRPKPKKACLFFYFISLFSLYQLPALGKTTIINDLKDQITDEFINRLTRERYEKIPDVLHNHLNIFQNHLPNYQSQAYELRSPTGRSFSLIPPSSGIMLHQILKSGYTQEMTGYAKELLRQARQTKQLQDRYLWNELYKSNRTSFSSGLSHSTGFNLNDNRKIYESLNLNVNLDSSSSNYFSETNNQWNTDFLQRNKQVYTYVSLLIDHLNAREKFKELNFPTNIDGTIDIESLTSSSEMKEKVTIEKDMIRFTDDKSEKDFEFNYKFLEEIEKSEKGKEITNFINQIKLHPSESHSKIPQEEFNVYLQILQNEKVSSLIENFSSQQETLVKNQEELKKQLVKLFEKLVEFESQVGENGDLRVEFSDGAFSLPDFNQTHRDRIQNYSNYLNQIEKKLKDSSLSENEKQALEKQKKFYKKEIKQIRLRRIQDIKMKADNYIHAGRKIAYFFADFFEADNETYQEIRKMEQLVMGSVQVAASLAMLMNGGGVIAVGGLFQGLNTLLGYLQDTDTGGSLEKSYAQSIIESVQQSTELILEHQTSAHRDIVRKIYDTNLQLSTRIRLLGFKLDYNQQFLYLLGDILEKKVQQIQESMEEIKETYLLGQRSILEGQKELLDHIYRIDFADCLREQRSEVQKILSEASGFRALFNPTENIANNIIACSKDFNSCTEEDINRMGDIKLNMEKLTRYFQSSIHSNDLSTFSCESSNMNREVISTYLGENYQSRVETRLGLFSVVGKWLNEHVENDLNNSTAEKDLDEISEISLDSFISLSHPELLSLFLAQYIELGMFLPENNVKLLDHLEESSYNEGINFMCKEALKHREASLEMRKAIPLAWKVYRNYLSQIKTHYLELKERARQSFIREIKTIMGEDYSLPVVRSSLFSDNEFQALDPMSNIFNENSVNSKSRKTALEETNVSLEDLLFLPESKIKIFVEKMEELEEWEVENLSEKMGAYVYKGSELQIKTDTCESKVWDYGENLEDEDSENLFSEYLSQDFWIPQSFDFIDYSDPSFTYKKMSFNCETKGAGHHVLEVYGPNPPLEPQSENTSTKPSFWLHYVCEENIGELQDENENKYRGIAWKIEVYKHSTSESQADAQASDKVPLNECNTCIGEMNESNNSKKCDSIKMSEYDFQARSYEEEGVDSTPSTSSKSKFNISIRRNNSCLDGGRIEIEGSWPATNMTNPMPPMPLKDCMPLPEISTLRFHDEVRDNSTFVPVRLRYWCDWHRPKEREVCAKYIEGSIKTRTPVVNRIELMRKLKDLRKYVLTQFKENIYLDIVRADDQKQHLAYKLSLAKLALVSLIYGGFGKHFVETSMPVLPFMMAHSLPAGFGFGMTLSKLSPEEKDFSSIGVNSYHFRKWMHFIENDFYLPEKLSLPVEEDLIPIRNEEEYSPNFFSGLGDLNYIYFLLAIASTNRNLILDKECVEGFNLDLKPSILQTHFPLLKGSSVEKKLAMINFIREKSSDEMREEKKKALLLMITEGSSPHIKTQIASAAGELKGEAGLEVLEVLSRDLNAETKLAVVQILKETILESVKRLEILNILAQDLDDTVSNLSYSLIKERAFQLVGLGEDEELDIYSLLSALSQLSAEGEREASVLLEIFFNYHDEVFKKIEEQLIHAGLLKVEYKKDEKDFYNFFKTILNLGAQGNTEASILFNFFIHYKEENKEIKKSIIRSVGVIQHRIGIKILKWFLNDQLEDDMEILIAETAGQIGDDEGAQILKELIDKSYYWNVTDETNWNKKIIILEAAGKIGDAFLGEALVRLFDSHYEGESPYLPNTKEEREKAIGVQIALLIDLVNENNPNVRLHLASKTAKYPTIIKILIQNGADPNAEDENGLTPLQLAARYNTSKEVIKTLIDNNASLDMRYGPKENTVLHLAAQYNEEVSILETLIEGGLDINLRNNKGETPLHIAISYNENEAIVETLISHGAMVEARNYKGWNSLHFAACCNKNSAIAEILLSNKALVKSLLNVKTNFQENTPLHIAVKYKNKLMMKTFLENGADVNAKNYYDQTPLYSLGDIESLEILLENEADLNVKDKYGNKILHNLAKDHEKLPFIKALIDHKVDVKEINNIGWTPLHYAANNNKNENVIKELIINGALVNAKTLTGLTPLHLAARNNKNVLVTETLINYEASIDEKNRDGWIPLHFATCLNENIEVIKALINDDIWNINAETDNKRTPLHLAAMCNRNLSVFEALVNRGANVRARDSKGLTLLHLGAYKNKNPAILKMGVRMGLDINSKDNDGWTALKHALDGENSIAINVLIKGKINTENLRDINMADKNSKTLLHYLSGHIQEPTIFEEIIKHGANLNTKDKDGIVPLHLVARYNNEIKIIEKFLEHEADVHVRDNKGRTVLHHLMLNYMESKNENLKALEIFLKNGVDKDIKDNEGLTFLEMVHEDGEETRLYKEAVRNLMNELES